MELKIEKLYMKRLLLILITTLISLPGISQLYTPASSASGTDTYAATVSSTVTSYNVGQSFLVRFTNANTGAATLNINSIGAKSIKKNVSTALVAGDIQAGQEVLLKYDGTNLQIVGGSGSVADAISDGVTTIAPSQNAVSDALALKANKATAYNTQTGSYTLVLSDADTKVIEMNVAGANTLTFPLNSSVAFSIGTIINVKNLGAGSCTLTPIGGVILTPSSGSTLVIPQGYWATAVKSATNTWDVISNVSTGAALTKVDDTNITLTLGGSPSNALNAATSITAGFTGQLAVGRGGTGLSGYNTGDLLQASSGSTLVGTPAVATGNAWISGGLSTISSWGKIGLTTHVSGTLPVTNGGTGFATSTNGDVVIGTGSNTIGVVNALATTRTSYWHLKAGTATASTSPLKFTTGTVNTTAEAGAFEYSTPQVFFTNGGLVRQEVQLVQQSRVATQFDATSNTTLSNITGLTANLSAGKFYRFKATLFTTSNVGGGVKFSIAGTATATNIIYETVVLDANINAAQTRSTALAASAGAVTAVTVAYVTINGFITCNAAGTMTVQFAQNSSNGSASSVLVGSNFEVNEMP